VAVATQDEVAEREHGAGGGGWWGWAVVAVAAGLLLFCHGCHDDEDHELFSPWRTWAGGQTP
jgi:hypothetical protein